MSEQKLTARQHRFVDEYLKDGNAAQAAIRAGFSAKTAKQIGSRLLTNVDLQRELAVRRAPILASVGLTVEGHLADLLRLRDKAVELEQMSAAIGAETARGKVVGYYGERYSAEEIARMSDEELNALAERVKAGRPAIRLMGA